MKEGWKPEFNKYLESLGVQEPLLKRIWTIHEFYEKICPEGIKDIFVNEYIKGDETREYESLWFFSETYLMEAKQFITKDDFDITPFKNIINYVKFIKQNYDFEKAEEKSRLNLIIKMDTNVNGTLKASKGNCDYLKKIIEKYIVPNLMK
jgi:hypothetical protein